MTWCLIPDTGGELANRQANLGKKKKKTKTMPHHALSGVSPVRSDPSASDLLASPSATFPSPLYPQPQASAIASHMQSTMGPPSTVKTAKLAHSVARIIEALRASLMYPGSSRALATEFMNVTMMSPPVEIAFTDTPMRRPAVSRMSHLLNSSVSLQ